MALRALLCGLAAVFALAGSSAGAAPLLSKPWVEIGTGPAGGQVWQGPIADRSLPNDHRPTLVYLPPNASRSARYPVLYLLHGLPGSPYSFVDGLALAAAADAEIAARRVRPFIAVMPPAGLDGRFRGEWTGVWETYLVDDVLPWVNTHLPAAGGLADAIGGLSAGGYGAVDIGLRHLGDFGTLESWSGYFDPYRDGSLAHAGPAELAAHDPVLLARGEAELLRRLHVRFFLSSGTTQDESSAAAASAFGHELAGLHVPYRLWLQPGGHRGSLWRAQLPAALAYAFPSQPAA